MSGSEALWQPIVTGIFTLLGVFIGIGATYFIERRMSQARDRRQRELLRRLLESEVEANLSRLQEEAPRLGELPRQYQKEVYYEMLPQIGLFQNELINQIMSFYHSLMHIEYLYQVYKSQSTAFSTVVVEARLPEAIQQSEQYGQELCSALQEMK